MMSQPHPEGRKCRLTFSFQLCLACRRLFSNPLLVSFMLPNYGSQATPRYSEFVTTGVPRLALDASCALK